MLKKSRYEIKVKNCLFRWRRCGVCVTDDVSCVSEMLLDDFLLTYLVFMSTSDLCQALLGQYPYCQIHTRTHTHTHTLCLSPWLLSLIAALAAGARRRAKTPSSGSVRYCSWCPIGADSTRTSWRKRSTSGASWRYDSFVSTSALLIHLLCLKSKIWFVWVTRRVCVCVCVVLGLVDLFSSFLPQGGPCWCFYLLLTKRADKKENRLFRGASWGMMVVIIIWGCMFFSVRWRRNNQETYSYQGYTIISVLPRV